MANSLSNELIHISEVRRILNKASRSMAPDYYDIVVGTIGGQYAVHYECRITNHIAKTERYRVKLREGSTRMFPLCLVMFFEGKEVIW